MNTQPNNTPEAFEGFAIIELMGRNVIAGYCSQELVAGVAMLRVDVPAVEERPAFTKFFSGGAIYAITPTDEETAQTAATRLRTRPVDLWIVPERKSLPAPVEQDDDCDDDEDDDEVDF